MSAAASEFETRRAIVFDAVGTLIHPSPPVAVAYAAAGRRFGSRLDEAAIGGRFARAFAAEEAADHDSAASALSRDRTDEERERRRWQSIVAHVFDDLADTRSLFEALWDHFAQPEHWALFADVEPTFAALRATGLRLAVASNFDCRLRGICRAKPALAAFDALFVSSELGHRKPSPDFFAAVAQALDCRPRQLLMVGDHLANDCLAPRAAGWQAIHLDRDGKHAAANERDSIASLTPLATIIAR